MTDRARVFLVDAFTARRFTGNPAGVVLEADDLSDTDMQGLARELQADTGFVLAADGDDHDLYVRFFTPRREAGFVGHATLAVHAVLAELGERPRPRQKQRAGLVRVDTRRSRSPPLIAMHLEPSSAERPIDPAALASVLEALSLEAGDLESRCPPVIVGEGNTRLLVGVTQGDVLARLQPDLPRLARLSSMLDVLGYFVFTLHPSLPEVDTEARMFCPALGIPEDPVSGNAHALLAGYLGRRQLIDDFAARAAPGSGRAAGDGTSSTGVAGRQAAKITFTGAQGHHQGRPGRVTVELSALAGQVTSVIIGGEAVLVFAAALEFQHRDEEAGQTPRPGNKGSHERTAT